jgi:predicted unusual protein kinase regulating ubiquinone biosynthesis (AarF/ABC1/UbiB family)
MLFMSGEWKASCCGGRKIMSILKPDQKTGPKLETKRYRRVRWFFAKAIIQILVWDVVFSLPVLKWLRPPALPRWKKVSRRYRIMAMELGGVMIKLGQFLSTRADLLPPEITRELAGLQDEVAAARYEAIVAQIEEDFNCPLNEIFLEVDQDPLGAASLAQAHAARLPDGTDVVIKVLRPGIDTLVATDLAVMQLTCGWLNHFRHVRSRIDLDLLMKEFTTTTQNELDLIAEMENLQRFSADFAWDPHVYVPKVHERYCAMRTLTLENVAYIKIADTKAIEACGISCSQVADRLYNIYMKQIFINNFIHVDPHPGNLFIRPLPNFDEREAGIDTFLPGQTVPYQKGRPFQIVFIDFGMTAVIPERLKVAMRVGAIGIGNKDASKVIQAYVMAGVIRPGIDLKRLEDAHEDWFRRIWGLRMGKIQEVAYREMRYFMREYRDLIAETPFQFQAEMLFVGRAIGILAGMATHLDPEFDPWAKAVPYAKQFAKEELLADWKDWPEAVIQWGNHLIKIPANLDGVLDKARQGSLAIQVSLSPQTRLAIRRIDLSVKRFSWMVLAAGLLVSGVNLYIADHGAWGVVCILLAVVVFLWGIRKV